MNYRILAAAILVGAHLAVAAQPVGLKSPDGKISLSIDTQNGDLGYAIAFNGQPVIARSFMGLLVDGKLIGKSASIGTRKNYAKNETYPYRGIHSTAVNRFNGTVVDITSAGRSFSLDARVFNDGVAFRYLVKNSGPAVIQADSTQFRLPAAVTVWSQPNNKHYEARYSVRKSDDVKKGEIAGPPLTYALPDGVGFAAITEGGLTDFAGMSLIADGQRGFTANLTGDTKKTGDFETSWRIVEIGKDLNALVNCDIVANVSPAFDKKLFPKGYDTEWLKPGRSVWSWLAGRGPVTLENMKKFTDLAAQLGFEYNLVDEGWGRWKDGDRDNFAMLKELVDYSKAKGVGIWAWKAYPDRGGIPGIKDPVKRREFFQKCKDLGVVGLKVDFFDTEAQEIIGFYQAALKDAAEFHLMMDFHGANKPTGEARTWPNEMSREGVKGLESRPPWAPTNTILPFTRYLAGHADFTPIHFGERLGEVTWAHHVASAVVFTSPFLCYGADPQSILDNPCKEMITSIPPVWDETIVLPQSRIGDLALFARRKGDTWFVAAMNGQADAKSVSVPLSFLKKGNYTMSTLKDDAAKQANTILSTETVSQASTVTLALNGNGGFVARISRSK